MAGARFATTWEGRRIEVEPVSTWAGKRARLLVDGEERAVDTKSNQRLRLPLAGEDGEAGGPEVHVWLGFTGESIKRAELRAPDAEPVMLTPAEGTREARREAWAQAHPLLWSAQHVVAKVAPLLVGFLGINLVLGLLPAIPFPDVDLPSIDLPSIPFPDVDLPDVSLPGWVETVLDAAKVVGPILVGVALAVAEYRRRKRHAAEETARASESSNRADGSSSASPNRSRSRVTR